VRTIRGSALNPGISPPAHTLLTIVLNELRMSMIGCVSSRNPANPKLVLHYKTFLIPFYRPRPYNLEGSVT